MVRGDHEAPHAGLAQPAQASADALQGFVEHGRPFAFLSGIVDLGAVHHHQPGPGHVLLEAREVAIQHLVQGQERTGVAAHPVCHGAPAGLGIEYPVLSGGNALDALVRHLQVQGSAIGHRRQGVHSHGGDRGQLGQTSIQVDRGGRRAFQRLVQFRGHLVAQSVHQQHGCGARFRCQRAHHLVKKLPLLELHRGQEPLLLA